MTKLYGKWIFCIGEKCPEGGDGKCRIGDKAVDYPKDGKCLFPEYVEYSGVWEHLGAFEREGETAIEATKRLEDVVSRAIERIENLEAASRAQADVISKLQEQVEALEKKMIWALL